VSDDQALLQALQTIREMAPDIKTTIADIATLKAEMANITTSTNKQFDMLVSMQRATERAKTDRWKMVIGFLVTLVVQAATALAVIYKK
jgi:hypothetical protein